MLYTVAALATRTLLRDLAPLLPKPLLRLPSRASTSSCSSPAEHHPPSTSPELFGAPELAEAKQADTELAGALAPLLPKPLLRLPSRASTSSCSSPAEHHPPSTSPEPLCAPELAEAKQADTELYCFSSRLLSARRPPLCVAQRLGAIPQCCERLLVDKRRLA